MLALFFVLAAAGGYLLGSIPFGLVLTRAAGLGDIRAIGSGNIGATNVLRTGRKDIALATLLLDAAKAGLALLAARALAGESEFRVELGLVAGAGAFIGHCFPVWLNFKGGKGVATFFGVLFAGDVAVGAAGRASLGWRWRPCSACPRWRRLCAAAIAPIAALIANFSWAEICFTLALSALIFWRHSRQHRAPACWNRAAHRRRQNTRCARPETSAPAESQS